MHLIFVLNRLDVLPYEDGAFMQAYKWLYPNDKVFLQLEFDAIIGILSRP